MDEHTPTYVMTWFGSIIDERDYHRTGWVDEVESRQADVSEFMAELQHEAGLRCAAQDEQRL